MRPSGSRAVARSAATRCSRRSACSPYTAMERTGYWYTTLRGRASGEGPRSPDLGAMGPSVGVIMAVPVRPPSARGRSEVLGTVARVVVAGADPQMFRPRLARGLESGGRRWSGTDESQAMERRPRAGWSRECRQYKDTRHEDLERAPCTCVRRTG